MTLPDDGNQSNLVYRLMTAIRFLISATLVSFTHMPCHPSLGSNSSTPNDIESSEKGTVETTKDADNDKEDEF